MLLSILSQPPAAKLPVELVDPDTGLPMNNVQASCKPLRTGEFLCVVRPKVHRPGEGLFVRYSTNDGFTWLPYRNGGRHVGGKW